jgi:mitogen-activated protein kinase 1/3
MEGFNLGPNYVNLEYLLKWAYGLAYSATHVPSGRRVAIKRIDAPFQVSDNLLARRYLREVRILRGLRHENVIALLDIIINYFVQKRREVKASKVVEAD